MLVSAFAGKDFIGKATEKQLKKDMRFTVMAMPC